MKKASQITHSVLNGRVSPMVYVMTAVSMIIGLCYSFFSDIPDIQRSILANYGLAFDLNVWGFGLLVGASTVMLGLIIDKDGFIKAGAMLAFMMWVFASITYYANDFLFALVTHGVFHMIFYVYVYLATSLRYIRRRQKSEF